MASLRDLLFSQFVSGAENTFLKVGTLGTTVQPLLVSNTNIKTVLGQTLLGSGNITIAASDVPNLDASKITSGTIDAARLPSYVDDVLEYANLAALPVTGETGKIYVALDTNKVYRWSGSAYIEISPAPDLSGYLPLSGGTLTGSITLNAGTANGIAYLNGSKVLTSGSALTFDGTTFGVTNASASLAFNATKSADGNVAFFRRVGGTYNPGFYISLSDTANNEVVFNSTYSTGNAPAFVWQNASNERMRLNDTGLGIGTSSPGQPLVVSKNQNASTWTQVSNTTSGTGAAAGLLLTSDSSIQATIELDSTGYTNFANMLRIRQVGAYPIGFLTNDTLRMTLNSSGNLGIGTSSPQDILDINSPAGTAAIRIATQGVGSLTWRIASQIVGVANAGFAIRDETNAVNRLVIDGSGNVGIGTSSPGERLDVVGTARVLKNTGATNTGDQNAVVVGATTSGAYAASYGAGLQFQVTNNSGGYSGGRIVSRLGADNFTANLVFQARNYGFSDSMTLDSNGRLLVGHNSPVNDNNLPVQLSAPINQVRFFAVNKATDYGIIFGYDNSSNYGDIRVVPSAAMVLSTNNTERVRITSAGDVGIGTSSPAAALHVASGNFRLTNGASFTTANSLIREINTASGSANQFVTASIGFRTGDFSDAGVITFGTANNASTPTERMRLDQVGNLGIGTNSPGQRLEVAGNILINTTANPSMTVRTSGAGNNPWYRLQADTNFWDMIGVFSDANDTLRFRYNNNDYLTLTNDGIVRIGNTTGGTSGLLRVGTNFSGTPDGALATSIRLSGSLEFDFDGVSGTQRHGRIRGTPGNGQGGAYGGGLAFQYYAWDGTTYSWFDGMSMDAAGSLGIGTTTPAARLDVRAPNVNGSTATIRVGTQIHGGAGDEFANLEFYWGDPDSEGVKAKIYAKNVGNVGPGGGGAADLLFATTPAGGSITERVRITSGGNLGIGTTSPSQRLSVHGPSFGGPGTSGTTQTNGAIRITAPGTTGVLDIGIGSSGTNQWLQATDSGGLNYNYNLLLNPNGGTVGIGNTNPSANATRLALTQPPTPSGTLPTVYYNLGWDNQGGQDNIGIHLQFSGGQVPNGSLLTARLGAHSAFVLNNAGSDSNVYGAGGRTPVYLYSGPPGNYSSYGQPPASNFSAAGAMPRMAIYSEMTGMYDGYQLTGLSIKLAGSYGGGSTRDVYCSAVQATTNFGSDRGYGTSYGYYANVSSNTTANYAFYAAAGDAAKPGGGSWASTSDARVKNVIGQYARGLQDVLQINVVDFTYNGKGGHTADGRVYTGVVAQELQPVFPEMVKTHRGKLEPTDEQDTDILMVDNSALVYALVNCVKELKAELDQVKLELQTLKG